MTPFSPADCRLYAFAAGQPGMPFAAPCRATNITLRMIYQLIRQSDASHGCQPSHATASRPPATPAYQPVQSAKQLDAAVLSV